ncbi:MAG: hypothetical protein N2517_02610 [Ignavibacteria bacterium]|nr:hypothetical protein [Ignavibacteria bacterium]
MPSLTIESNGTIEMTAVYFNGQQIAGLTELFLNLHEDGTFDSVLVYKGLDGKEYTKNPFIDYLDSINYREPAFSEWEARQLKSLVIESDGEIENTTVYYNGEILDGLVNIFIHIKAPKKNKTSIASLFNKGEISEGAVFRATFTFRYQNDVLKTEEIF